MEKFTKLTGVAAPMDMINIDTDMVIPKQFLKTVKRKSSSPATTSAAARRASMPPGRSRISASNA